MSVPGATTSVVATRVRGLAISPIVRRIALLALRAAYLQSGFDKATDFAAAEAELIGFGVTPPPPFAALTIVVEFGGSFLILSGICRWLGALGLAGFTLFASMLANRFSEIPGPAHIPLRNAFFEHIGLAGGFLLVAWHDWTAARSARG